MTGYKILDWKLFSLRFEIPQFLKLHDLLVSKLLLRNPIFISSAKLLMVPLVAVFQMYIELSYTLATHSDNPIIWGLDHLFFLANFNEVLV